MTANATGWWWLLARWPRSHAREIFGEKHKTSVDRLRVRLRREPLLGGFSGITLLQNATAFNIDEKKGKCQPNKIHIFPSLMKMLFLSASRYRKITTISPGLIFVQKVFLVGLFSREVIFGGASYWRGFCVSKWIGLANKNSLKHYENSLKQLTLTVHGLIFGRAYHRKDICI